MWPGWGCCKHASGSGEYTSKSTHSCVASGCVKYLNWPILDCDPALTPPFLNTPRELGFSVLRSGIFHASDLALTRALTLMVSVLTVTEQRLSYLPQLLADPPSVWQGRRCRHCREQGKLPYMPPIWLGWISACRSCCESLKRYIDDSTELVCSMFMWEVNITQLKCVQANKILLVATSSAYAHVCLQVRQIVLYYSIYHHSKSHDWFICVNNFAKESSCMWNDGVLVAFLCLLSSRPTQSMLPRINHCVKVAFQRMKWS